jgi:large subunit ribosomal protein L6
MSRIGRLPVSLPDKVELSIKEGAVTVKGPLGEHTMKLPEGITVSVDGGIAVLSRRDDSAEQKRMHGTTRAHLANWVTGLSAGHTKVLMVEGKGYQGELNGKVLEMQLGFCHKVLFEIPKGIRMTVAPGQNAFTITVSGSDRHLVGAVASELYKIKPVEPYNLIGLRYSDQHVRRKTVKTIT